MTIGYLSRRQHQALLALAFVLIEAMLILYIDKPLALYLHQVDTHSPGFINFFRAYTDLGLSCWYLWPSGIGAIACFVLAAGRILPAGYRETLRRTGWMLGFFFASVAASGIITDAIKPLIGRARPILLTHSGIYGFHPFTAGAIYNSFPSGHATTAFAVALALAVLFPRARIWLLVFAVVISISRVMVNAHYLSDIPAGAAVAFFTVAATQKLFRRICGARVYGIFPIDSRPAAG